MRTPIPAFSLLLLSTALAAAAVPELRMRAQTIDAKIQIGYGLAVADVDGDGRADILLADAKQIVWYRAPDWRKFVMAENLTAKDNVCIAARDLDGDGKAEVAVGAEWNPADTVGSGAVFLLEAPADRTQRWTPRRLPHEPTTHRMFWVRTGERRFGLAVLPLHGRGNKNGAGEGVQLHAYGWPWKEGDRGVPLMPTTPALHLTHNFDLLPAASGGAGETLLLATKEGLRLVDPAKADAVPATFTSVPAGEVRAGRLAGGARFLATIEPMHGNAAAVYPVPAGAPTDLTARRILLDDTLVQGHGLAVADLLGHGSDQIVVGWRGGTPGAKVGIRVFAAGDAQGATWRLLATVDDNTMAVEDLKVADLDGDGRPEIIAAGRATKNVIIYWNETARAPASARE